MNDAAERLPGDLSATAVMARPLRVLQVLPSLKRGGGGVERSAIDVARAVTAAGGTALVTSAGGRMVDELLRARIPHIELPLASKNPLVIHANIARLARLIDEHDIDIVHARSRAPAWSAYYAARRTERHFVTTFHGTYNYAGRLKHRYNAIMARGERIIANSRYIALHIAEFYRADPATIRVIPRGVDVDRFSREQVSAERMIRLAQEWRLPDGVPVVMLPGRLARWKGHRLLIEALARMGRSDLVCVIVGSAQGRRRYRDELAAFAQERGVASILHIRDHCDDMPAAYMLADIVLSASIEPEAFGRVIAEAQAMGRPVVVARHGGGPEQILEGRTGWSFTPGDPDDLARALNQVLSLEPTRRAALADTAARHARLQFTNDAMCAATLDVYAELMMTAMGGQ